MKVLWMCLHEIELQLRFMNYAPENVKCCNKLQFPYRVDFVSDVDVV